MVRRSFGKSVLCRCRKVPKPYAEVSKPSRYGFRNIDPRFRNLSWGSIFLLLPMFAIECLCDIEMRRVLTSMQLRPLGT
ncbi:hypothetical protein V6N13_076234 [Hibiscus sabdariffa]